MNLNKLVLIILVSASSVFAQDIGTTEVKIVEGFKPAIPEASRLNENATFADTMKKDRTQIYEVLNANLKSDYKTKPLAVAQVKDDKIPKLYGTKAGLGFGSALTTKANVVHNSKRSRTLSYGIIANHFANKYSVAKNSKNTMHLYVKKISSSYILLANLDYDRRTTLYYDQKINLEADRFFRNRFAYTKLSFSVISKETSEKQLKHHTTFFISDLNEFSENQIHLGSNLSKTINGLAYSLTIEFDNYLRYNNSDSKVKNTDLKIISLSPNTSFVKYGVYFDLGFDFDFVSDDSSIGFFPKIKATKELVKDVLLIYGGLGHSEQKHTLKSLSDENPYIHSFGINQSILGDSSFLQSLENTDVQELYLGMRNVLAKGEVIEGGIAYGIVQNIAHFISVDHHIYDRFQVAYLDVKQLHVSANYSRKINEILGLNVNADYFNWDVDVYHKPNLTANLSAPINLRNKIKAAPAISYIGKRSVMDASISELPAQIHANLGLYYFYSKQLSAYLQFNNLTNSKQALWLGYREVGFNAVFGVNFSF
ncbi:MAG: hypothetical protein VYB55_03140 [Bacteroidota bacterium]|nr:hypothetical protein [Bacteroidota bacterium]